MKWIKLSAGHFINAKLIAEIYVEKNRSNMWCVWVKEIHDDCLTDVFVSENKQSAIDYMMDIIGDDI